MASKQNEDLFNQTSKQNEGSLPLDFAGGAGKEPKPKKEPESRPEAKASVSEPIKKEIAQSAAAPIPHASQYSADDDPGRSDLNGLPRKPIHHVPPPYKKSVQEQPNAQEAKESKTESPASSPAPAVQTHVQEKIPETPKPPVAVKQEVKTPVPAPVPAPAAVKAPEPEPVQAPAPAVSAQASTPEKAPVQAIVPPPSPPLAPAVSTPVPDPAPATEPVQEAVSKPAAETVVSTPSSASVPAAPVIPVQAAVPTPKPEPKQEKKEPVKLQPKVKEPKIEKKPEQRTEQKIENKVEKPHVSHVPHKKEAPIVQQSPVPSPVQPKVHEVKTVKQEEKKEIPKSKKFNIIEKFSSDNATAGQILQEGRVRLGTSIDQISTTTKIKKNFIEALERDDYQNLPAPVYVNAYVRSLCYLYRIDEHQVLSLLSRAKGKSLEYTVPEEVIHHIEKGKQINIIQEIKVKRITLTIIAACLILVAGTFVIYQLLIMNKPQVSQEPPVKAVKVAPVNPNPVKTPAPNSVNIQDQMEKKLVSPHVFTMSQLPLPEQR